MPAGIRPSAVGRRRLRRRQNQGSRRSRGRSQAAGDVHRVDRPGRAAPSRLRSRRQLDRRGAGRLLPERRRHDPHRRLGDRRRRRPRHSGGHARERQVGRRGRADRAPRRRQVRELGLQGLRRPARRRRVGRQRAVRVARARDLAQRPGAPAALRARHADGRRSTSPARTEKRGTKITFKPDTDGLRDDRVQLRDAVAAAARAGVPERRRLDHDRRRARRQEAPVPLRGRHPRVRRVPEQEPDAGQREADLHDGRARRHRRRDRAAVERQLHRDDLHLREQHQHHRRRHAPVGLPRGADAHDQPLRVEEQPRREAHARASAATTSARA